LLINLYDCSSRNGRGGRVCNEIELLRLSSSSVAVQKGIGCYVYYIVLQNYRLVETMEGGLRLIDDKENGVKKIYIQILDILL